MMETRIKIQSHWTTFRSQQGHFAANKGIALRQFFQDECGGGKN
jgi:hypothetical protein